MKYYGKGDNIFSEVQYVVTGACKIESLGTSHGTEKKDQLRITIYKKFVLSILQ